MTQEILLKLHTALEATVPLASDRERIIASMGETIWLESLQKMLEGLPEDARNNVVALLNEGKLEEAVEIVESNSVDIEGIMQEVAKSVLAEVVSQ